MSDVKISIWLWGETGADDGTVDIFVGLKESGRVLGPFNFPAGKSF